MSAGPKRFVYILRCQTTLTRHYVGVTSDVAARLADHNDGRCLSTRRHRPWVVLVAVEFGTPERALHFERYLKSGSGRAFAKRHFG